MRIFKHKMIVAKEKMLGFTLIEALVAISVLLLGIIGPMALAQRSLSVTVHTKDQVTAFFLAQDAIEHIKNMRDSDREEGTTHFDTLSICTEPSGCYLDTTLTASFPIMCGGVCPNMQHHILTGRYGYGTGVDWDKSNFIRTIRFTSVTPYEERIEVRVEWKTNGQTRSIILERHFYDIEST